MKHDEIVKRLVANAESNSKILGHSKPSVTMNMYTHASVETVRNRKFDRKPGHTNPLFIKRRPKTRNLSVNWANICTQLHPIAPENDV